MSLDHTKTTIPVQSRPADAGESIDAPRPTAEPPLADAATATPASANPVGRFLLGVGIATLVLVNPWMAVIRGALADDLYSYVVLVPVICGWLVWQRRPLVSQRASGDARVACGLFAAAAICGLAGVYARRSGLVTVEASWLTTQMAAWVLAVWGATVLQFGVAWIRTHLFATAFLLFTIPLPQPAVDGLEIGLQVASAEASDFLFSFAGTPYLRDGMTFWFPGVRIAVAPECSGIRSTLVLFITGVLGSYLLLQRPLHRCLLVALIFPLGVFRNAIRILTLTLLSVHVDPEIMHSALHKRGGPLFFAVSLIPLFLLFWWLARRERRSRPPSPTAC